MRERPRHDVAGLAKTLALAEPILAALGFGGERAATIETDDPDALGAALRTLCGRRCAAPRPASFLPVGRKREVMRLALRELQRAAPTPVDIVAAAAGAPFGAVELDAAGCTLCLACVSACPTGALGDDPERPLLRFIEDACVQCGLCKATCPEKVITLKPQLDFRAATASARVLKDEEPFHCIRCGKPFGVKSTIERVTGKLAGKHWMFAAPGNVRRASTSSRCARTAASARSPRTGSIRTAPRRGPGRAPPTTICASARKRSGRARGSDDSHPATRPHRHARHRLRDERAGGRRAGHSAARLALRSARL